MSDIIKDLYNPKYNKLAILGSIKMQNYSDCKKKLKAAYSNPIAKNLILSNPLPKGYDELRRGRLVDYSNNLQGEIAWIVETVKRFKNEINLFLKFQLQFEENLFLGNYDVSDSVLSKIENEICFSFWGLENKFSLVQQRFGVEENWTLLTEFNQIFHNNYALFFTEIFSKKAEIENSLLQYNRSIEGYIQPLTNIADKEFVLFKAAYFLFGQYTKYSFFLFFESTSSIIDRYEMLINVLGELVNSNLKDDRDLSIKILDEIYPLFSDSRIKRLLEISNNSSLDCIPNDIFEILDSFTLEKYSECLITIPELIRKYPSNIELFELYIDTLVETKSNFVPTGISPIIDSTLSNLFDLLIRNDNYFIARENLLKLYLSFSQLPSFKQLLGIVGNASGILSEKNMYTSFYLMNSKISNPISYYLIRQHGTPNSRLDESANKYLISKVYSYIAANDIMSINNNVDISEARKAIYIARAQFLHNENVHCIETLISAFNNYSYEPIFYEEIIYYLYYSYIKTDNLTAAISLCVNSYFLNNNLLSRIDTNILIDKIIDGDFNIPHSIDLPIFFNISNTNSYYLYVSLDNYLISINKNTPSQIEDMDEKAIFLLRYICSIEILNKFYLTYNDYVDVIEERKQILIKLIEVDKSNLKTYFEEKTSITQKEKIKGIINRVNDGKIRLNFSKLKSNKESNIENSFSRFLKMKEFSKNNNATAIDLSEIIQGYLQEFNSPTKQFHDASFLAFKSIFFEIIDQFLLSKEYGLDGDISTKIRHGVLENQIRSVFINHNIIAKKNQSEDYDNVEYWDTFGNQNNYREEKIKGVHEKVKKFSKSVDKLIHRIVNEQMQVRSNMHREKEKALFNYYFVDEYLWIIYKDILSTPQSYEEFIEYNYGVLNEHTQNVLKEVRMYFRENVNNEIQELLDDLLKGITDILDGSLFFLELSKAIINSKTQIEYELENIAGWFKITDTAIEELLDFETVIQTSIELINLSNPNFKISPEIDCKVDTLFPNYPSFIDILIILLDNILKHSELDNPVIKLKVWEEITNDLNENYSSTLNIVVSNKFGNSVNEGKLMEVFSSIQENWNNRESSNVNKEGGSGYLKIKRILNHELTYFKNSFDFALDRDNLTVQLKLYSKIKQLTNDE